MTKLTVPMHEALRSASIRADGSLCPVRGIHGRAEEMLLRGLDKRGLISARGPVPQINDAGRRALADWDARA